MKLSSGEVLFALCLFLTARNEFPVDKISAEKITANASERFWDNIVISWDNHINCAPFKESVSRGIQRFSI